MKNKLLVKTLIKAILRSTERLKQLVEREAPDICLDLEMKNLQFRFKQLTFLRNCEQNERKVA